ncbi:hypothetical protein OG625_25415 [Streptomyces sp. NBC_01351]|uniref:hypothetical protein n=1 Tax=Streptomyces sp. NBC_01351 TaxID=2903833 RepID=UPI002E3501E9|nr:hypothetical protein [Streptomyces sp. NBC_01351]
MVADTTRPPHGIAYLLPGGGLNFAADFAAAPGTSPPSGVSRRTTATWPGWWARWTPCCGCRTSTDVWSLLP